MSRSSWNFRAAVLDDGQALMSVADTSTFLRASPASDGLPRGIEITGASRQPLQTAAICIHDVDVPDRSVSTAREYELLAVGRPGWMSHQLRTAGGDDLVEPPSVRLDDVNLGGA